MESAKYAPFRRSVCWMIKHERWLHCSLGFENVYVLPIYKWGEHWTFLTSFSCVNVTGVQFSVLKHGWFYSRLPPDMRQRKWRARENEWAWGEACSCPTVGKSHLLSPQLVLVTHGWRRRRRGWRRGRPRGGKAA